MPDLGPWIECNGCGKKSEWDPATASDSKRGVTKRMPEGWIVLNNTVAGTAYFCCEEEKQAFTNSREWYIPPFKPAVKTAQD